MLNGARETPGAAPAATGTPARPPAAVRLNRAARRAGQAVWVPESMVRGPFGDDAVMVYIKVAALDARRSGGDPAPCEASVATLARYCGVSKSLAERGLRQLCAPGPNGGAPWIRTVRRTYTGGRGRTAERHARLVPTAEPALLVPVAAAECLTPRQLRAYLHLMRAAELRLPVAAADLAGELRHHSGVAAGRPLGGRTGRRLLDALAEAGWISMDPRGDLQGRHRITVHRSPLHAVPDPQTAPVDEPTEPEQLLLPLGLDDHDGSGADDHDGSLASNEDSSCSPDPAAAALDIRRRRGAGREGVDNPGRPPAAFAAAPTVQAGRPPYTGPQLTVSPRVWDVLEPVRHLLPDLTPYVARRLARTVGHLLDAGTEPARLRDRIERRYACTETVRDPGRWLLGAALPRRGCALEDCEGGRRWSTGEPCPGCTPAPDAPAAGHRHPPAAADRPPGRPPERPRPHLRPACLCGDPACPHNTAA